MRAYIAQAIYVFCATASSISDGMQYGWCSPTVPKLLQEDSPIRVKESQAMWLDSTYMIGGFAGIPFTIIFADKIGRKLCILSASIIFLFVWLLTIFGTSIDYYFAARFLAGLAGNISFVCIPMYIGEVADKRIRGFLGAFLPINVLTGIIIVYCTAPFVSIAATACVGISFPIFQLCTFTFMPESPYYLIMKNDIEKAKACLRKLRRTKDIDKELEEITQAVRRQQSESAKLKDIYKAKSNRRAMAIMMFLHSAQHFGAISVLVMNLHTILQDVSGMVSTNTAAIIFSLTMMVSIVISSSLIDKFGRRVLLVISGATTGVCLFALAVYFTLKDNGTITTCSWIPALFVILYAACFRIGLGVLPLVVTSEIFSTNVKAIGMTLSDVCYIIFGTLSLNIFHFMSRSYGMAAPFYLFACYCAFTVVVTILYLPETKGKTLEEIQMILKGVKGIPTVDSTGQHMDKLLNGVEKNNRV